MLLFCCVLFSLNFNSLFFAHSFYSILSPRFFLFDALVGPLNLSASLVVVGEFAEELFSPVSAFVLHIQLSSHNFFPHFLVFQTIIFFLLLLHSSILNSFPLFSLTIITNKLQQKTKTAQKNGLDYPLNLFCRRGY